MSDQDDNTDRHTEQERAQAHEEAERQTRQRRIKLEKSRCRRRDAGRRKRRVSEKGNKISIRGLTHRDEEVWKRRKHALVNASKMLPKLVHEAFRRNREGTFFGKGDTILTFRCTESTFKSSKRG